ncbi:SAE1 enzyme, partial [Brachypteracias leptosomus]|nr:SAE1 enzyme [Brachypteracias leptosomus]
VCLTGCPRDLLLKVDQICHQNSIKFFTGDVFGFHGYMFADLGEHEFVENIPFGIGGVFPGKGPPPNPISPPPKSPFPPPQRVVFCPLKEALAVDWSGEKAKAALKRTTPDYFLLQ